MPHFKEQKFYIILGGNKSQKLVTACRELRWLKAKVSSWILLFKQFPGLWIKRRELIQPMCAVSIYIFN
jgi:hypothetical protein